MRQYEIHLPSRHNNDIANEAAKIKRIRKEVFKAFGCWAAPCGRAWRYDGVEYVVVIKIEFITSSYTVASKRLGDFKKRLKESLQQSDILIMAYDIQVV